VVITGVWIAHTTSVKGNYRMRLQADSSIITLFSNVRVRPGRSGILRHVHRVQEPGWGALIALAVALTLLITAIRFLFMGGWFLLGPKLSPDRFTDRRGTGKEFIAIALLGVRGPISVLAAFSIPVATDTGEGFPGRDLILCVTFAVVIVSAAVQLPFVAQADSDEPLDPSLVEVMRPDSSQGGGPQGGPRIRTPAAVFLVSREQIRRCWRPSARSLPLRSIKAAFG
jgi:hypothetical protein